MPIVITLTSAAHGGATPMCGDDGHACGPDCACGCPYTGMHERGKVEDVVAIESRYRDAWLALVIPPGEDEYHPERAMLVAYGHDEDEVFAAATRVTHNQVLHVYYNGSLADYLAWADAS